MTVITTLSDEDSITTDLLALWFYMTTDPTLRTPKQPTDPKISAKSYPALHPDTVADYLSQAADPMKPFAKTLRAGPWKLYTGAPNTGWQKIASKAFPNITDSLIFEQLWLLLTTRPVFHPNVPASSSDIDAKANSFAAEAQPLLGVAATPAAVRPLVTATATGPFLQAANNFQLMASHMTMDWPRGGSHPEGGQVQSLFPLPSPSIRLRPVPQQAPPVPPPAVQQ